MQTHNTIQATPQCDTLPVCTEGGFLLHPRRPSMLVLMIFLLSSGALAGQRKNRMHGRLVVGWSIRLSQRPSIFKREKKKKIPGFFLDQFWNGAQDNEKEKRFAA